MGKLSKPYKGLRYNNLNGYVNGNGAVKRVTFGEQGPNYNAIGCSGFVVPMLNKTIHHKDWASHQRSNWRLYQKTGSDIAAAFGLPFAITLGPAEVKSPTAIQSLISQKRLMAGQRYLFDTRSGKAGHTGFIEVRKDGTLKSYMFSGISKGKDLGDETFAKPPGSSRKIRAPRSKLSGYTEGIFANWYQSSQYRSSKVHLFRLPLVIPDVLTGAGGTIGDSLGSESGCGFTSQLALGSKVSFRLDYNCETRKGIATVTGDMDATSDVNGLLVLDYIWQGEMTWKGDVFSGVLERKDLADRPSVTLTITPDGAGNFLASTVIPFTYLQYQLDGSCTTPVTTHNYSLANVPLVAP